jgi:hypothetical protein
LAEVASVVKLLEEEQKDRKLELVTRFDLKFEI